MIKICMWPEGTWCDWEDLEEYLAWMSDDFVIMSLCQEEYDKLH
jgi:hypothetical protein